MDLKDLEVAFRLGLRIAEMAYGVERDKDLKMASKFIGLLRQITEGEISMYDTPEELVGPKQEGKDRLLQDLGKRLVIKREEERRVAAEIEKLIPGSSKK